MMDCKLLHNAVLNYLFRSMKTGVKSDSLIKSCVQFFEKDAILEAKKYCMMNPDMTSDVFDM